ncbi:MAG: acylphosphatase [Rhodospirillaceae bacterium]
MADLVTKRLRITGRVQGVGYRDWTIRTARNAGLTGWVRNRADGAVEAVVRGPAVTVETFVAACQAGPPLARVKAVETTPEEAQLEPGFRQLPTV